MIMKPLEQINKSTVEKYFIEDNPSAFTPFIRQGSRRNPETRIPAAGQQDRIPQRH
jgi:hypothetical protein